MKLSDLFPKEQIFRGNDFSHKKELLGFLVDQLVAKGRLPRREPAFSILWERETYMTTGIGGGFAIPHGRCFDVSEAVGALYLSPEGMEFQALDRRPVHVVAMFLSHPQAQTLHLQLMRLLTKTFRQVEVQQALLAASSEEEVYEYLCRLPLG